MNTPADVYLWSQGYPVAYDETHYFPHITAARRGDTHALRLLMQWKNVGGKGAKIRPMCLWVPQEAAFQNFLDNLDRYLGPQGSNALRADFRTRSPVYAIFWHHVLFDSPIFDRHTNRAFTFFTTGDLLRGDAAAVRVRGHWDLYDRYTEWFNKTLAGLQGQDPDITERMLDRALMRWGIAHKQGDLVKKSL